MKEVVFIQKVEDILFNDYLVTINDCTDIDEIKVAFKDGESPQEFVDHIGMKYNLDKVLL